VDALKAVNLAIRFALELCAIAALFYWGTQTGDGLVSWLLALVAAGLFVLVWGTLLAPRAPRRLSMRARIPLELVLFGLAGLALALAGPSWLGIAFVVGAYANIAIVYALAGEEGGGATVSR
jgi:Protein of unknown function (DUF2568)